jgi:hypothetical protein
MIAVPILIRLPRPRGPRLSAFSQCVTIHGVVNWLPMDERTKWLADVIIESCKLVAVVIGGLWVYFRFRREDTHSPKVSFDIEATFFPVEGADSLAEFLMVINNKGLVNHKFKKIRLRVRGLSRGEAVKPWKDTQRVEFPHKLIDDADVLYTDKYGSIFVEGGITQKLTFVATIPADTRFVLAWAEFQYLSGLTHSAERVFEVIPKQATSVLSKSAS